MIKFKVFIESAEGFEQYRREGVDLIDLAGEVIEQHELAESLNRKWFVEDLKDSCRVYIEIEETES